MAVEIDRGSALSTLSLTPLIDIVFLLLIFFLVATRFAEEERELDVMLPDASEAQPLTSTPQELFVNIDDKGAYYVTGKVVELPELENILKAAYVNNPGRASVVIRADRRVPLQYAVSVMNACNKTGIRDYRLTTKKSGG
jgi:biopolymer transport protein ExbD